MRFSPPFIGFLESACLTLYVGAVVYLMQTLGTRGVPSNPTLQGISILLLFVLSAMISATIMLGYPTLLFRGGKTKPALTIVGWGIVWLAVFFVGALILAIIA